MYVGLNFKIKSSLKDDDFSEFLKTEEKLSADCVLNTKSILDSYLLPNGNLNGNKMQKDWFPKLKADVFLSHSHSDRESVLILAGVLKDFFGLNCFIDSSVWGYSEDLLKQIDNQLCMKKDGHYDYSKRNYTAAHVHMMLNVALSQMIDKCECLLFINTPNSVSSKDVVSKTESAWIYAEIATSKLVRRKKTRPDKLVKSFSDGGDLITESIEYDLDLDHLYEIDSEDLSAWAENISDGEHSLDILYTILAKQNLPKKNG